MKNVTFRFAQKNDSELVLKFIKDLAKYEKLENEVVATKELLDKWLFEEKKAEVIFAVLSGKEVGFALFFSTFSTFLGRPGNRDNKGCFFRYRSRRQRPKGREKR